MTDPIRGILNLFSITDYSTPLENIIQDITHAKEDSKTFFFSERNLTHIQSLFRDNDIVIKWFTEKKGVTENDETVKDLAEASKEAKK